MSSFTTWLKLGLLGTLTATSLNIRNSELPKEQFRKPYTQLEKQLFTIAQDTTYKNEATLQSNPLCYDKWVNIFSYDSLETILWSSDNDSVLNVVRTKFANINKEPFLFDTTNYHSLTQQEIDERTLNAYHLLYTGKPMPEDKAKRPISMAFGRRHQIVNGVKRLGPFLYHHLDYLEEVHMHPSFLTISIIESSYNPHAVSRARATGAWQLMYGTAKDLGLTISRQIINKQRTFDFRKDHIASFKGSATYMKKIENKTKGYEFLAPPMYNYGPNRRVFRKITTKEEALKVINTLNKETRNYLYEIMAVQTVMEKEIVKGTWSDFTPEKIRVYKLKEHLKVSEIEEKLGVDKETFFSLNPQYMNTDKDWYYTLRKGREIVLPE